MPTMSDLSILLLATFARYSFGFIPACRQGSYQPVEGPGCAELKDAGAPALCQQCLSETRQEACPQSCICPGLHAVLLTGIRPEGQSREMAPATPPALLHHLCARACLQVVVCHEQGGDPKWEQVPNRVLEVKQWTLPWCIVWSTPAAFLRICAAWLR